MATPPWVPHLNEDAIQRNHARIQRAIEWLRENWGHAVGGDHRCEVCGNDAWLVGFPVVLSLSDPPEPGAGVPFFPLTCEKCGNTKLLNAFATGIEVPTGHA